MDEDEGGKGTGMSGFGCNPVSLSCSFFPFLISSVMVPYMKRRFARGFALVRGKFFGWVSLDLGVKEGEGFPKV